jgi:hypothetical protein
MVISGALIAVNDGAPLKLASAALVVALVIANRVRSTEAQRGWDEQRIVFFTDNQGVGAEVLRGDMVGAGTFLVWLRQG